MDYDKGQGAEIRGGVFGLEKNEMRGGSVGGGDEGELELGWEQLSTVEQKEEVERREEWSFVAPERPVFGEVMDNPLATKKVEIEEEIRVIGDDWQEEMREVEKKIKEDPLEGVKLFQRLNQDYRRERKS